MSGAIPPLPNTPSWRGAHLKHGEDFTFTLPLQISFTETSAHANIWIRLLQFKICFGFKEEWSGMQSFQRRSLLCNIAVLVFICLFTYLLQILICYIHEKIKSRINSRTVCCHSVQNILRSRLLSRSVKIEVYTCCFVWAWDLVCDPKGRI
jgi:hypothetical protein